MCAAGAPEAAALIAAGLTEGSSITHPGQGTANRRFFFENIYVELVWVSDAEEARRELMFVFADRMEEVLDAALSPRAVEPPVVSNDQVQVDVPVQDATDVVL